MQMIDILTDLKMQNITAAAGTFRHQFGWDE
jgi:hypothetical protein